MCGVCGYLSRRGPADATTIAAMTRTLAHRGPDDERTRVDGPLALGHRRLSIIDLSEASSEPMANEDGSLWLVFNGEIYNFAELRRDLETRHPFRSQGDGEVILHLYEEHGLDVARHLDGMFAFALWDVPRQRLLLARDRTGKKPLVYHDGPELFAFASEAKALLAHPGVPREIDPAAFAPYLALGYVPTPATFRRGIRALPPGHRMTVTAAGASAPERFWQARFEDGPDLDEAEAADELRRRLTMAVKRRLVADVPLGAFLSGGLDSSAVVALMAETAGGRVKTFTIGFAGQPAYDETAHARVVAQHFATDHTEFLVEPGALELVDRLVFHHDAPFGDSSAIPTFLLSELTRRHVTVALNGDGGDEVLAGYLRLYGGALAEEVPAWLRRAAGAGAALLPEPRDRRHVLRYAKRFLEAAPLPLADRYFRWSAAFGGCGARLLRPEVRAAADDRGVLEGFRSRLPAAGSPLARLLQLNFDSYLLDDLLVKADRMTMAHGLEARSPFLDTAVVELGARLPDRLRMRRGRGKLVLRRMLQGLLPPSILERGKMGFGAPLGAWFRGDLGGLVRERLLDRGSPLYAHLEPEPVAAIVADHMAARGDLSQELWSLLTLESFLRQERSR